MSDAASSTDLADFLLARIAEDEAVARAATPGPWVAYDCSDATFDSGNRRGWWWVWREEALPYFGGVLEAESHPPDCVVGECQVTDARDGEREKSDAIHIAHWDPARALAECVAKRRIVAHHNPCDDRSYGDASTCPELSDLALPYADHPDYRQEWTP